MLNTVGKVFALRSFQFVPNCEKVIFIAHKKTPIHGRGLKTMYYGK